MRTLAWLLVVSLGACGGGSSSPADANPDQPDADPNAPDAGAPPVGAYFPDGPWYHDISSAPTDPNSDAIITYLDGLGWGLGHMQIDFSIEVLQADSSTPKMDFIETGDFYDPDCDHPAGGIPVPAGGALEGENGYECLSDGDCHLIVADRDAMLLYEMWRANITGGTFYGGCLAVWDMARIYPHNGRGDGCTSADAAGYSIAALLFTADEVAAGEIPHAIRYILPNDRIRPGVYVHPSTHSTSPTGGPDAPPYGTRLRLRDDYPLETLPSDGARVVARAMQTYGMFLADGGNVALTAQSDRFTTAKWAGLLDPRDLDTIQPGDFDVVIDPSDPDTSTANAITYTGDCVRNP
jgi:hypothetical protein